jgi:hypothetical protein
MGLTESEFTVLRRTIATRGTARIILLPATFFGWSTVISFLLLSGQLRPSASLFSLAVLAAGYEAIHALHVGVERIGRYLQVYYETGHDGPQWETTCMSVGPALPGGGVDPLFSILFASAAVANLTPVFLSSPTRATLAVIGVIHGAFLVRLGRARWAAARQRAVELESYRAIRSGSSAARS